MGQESGLNGEPFIIRADVVNHVIRYSVNDKPAIPNLLEVLNAIGREHGKSVKVIVLIDSKGARINNLNTLTNG